jgi:transglutaminase-like putative cysteine protease/predicted glutamine amidotransferase
MSQILTLSFDCPSSPSIILKLPIINEQTKKQSYGQGFAWYNNDELSATVVKETKYASRSTLIKTMEDVTRFHSTIFIGHIRGAAKKLVQKDTQPFSRSFAGRDWIFVHSGDLQSDYALHLPFDTNTIFEPIGSTDSEYIFCYLLEKIKNANARSLVDVGWPLLFSWLQTINQLGTANFMLSDGDDTIIYHDRYAYNQLYWLRSCPPHLMSHFETDVFSIEITLPFDVHHTFILVANESISHQCEMLKPSQMLVLRRGKVVWDSASDEHFNMTLSSLANMEIKQSVASEEVKNEKPYAHPIEHENQIIDYVASSERKYFSLFHETIYRYDRPVELSKHIFHLHPVNDHIQTTLEYKLVVSVPGYGEFFEDVFGNIATFYRINMPYKELIVRSESIVSLAINPSHFSEYLHQRRDIPLLWLPWQRQMMSPYLLPPELPESELNELIDFAMSFVKRNNYDLMEVLNDINQTIYRDFSYVSGSSSLKTTPYDLFMTRRGVCQDFTNLFICLARLLNVPARYRIGYIYSNADYDRTIQSQASHAWVEVYLPYIGWYGFDPTNGCVAGDNHIRIASGRNYVDATPTTGTIYKGGGREDLAIFVHVKTLPHYQIKNFS